MKLSAQQIESITKGAVRIEECDGGVAFHRFTASQELYYRTTNASFYTKSLATAGVRLQFKTNSQRLFLKAELTAGSSRTYYAFDVFTNGEFLDSLNNISSVELPTNYVGVSLPLGMAEKQFDLGDGEKTVCVYFPWSVAVKLLELSVDEDAVVEPIAVPKKLLAFGDSITQGYDAVHPSVRYIGKLADHLGMEEINKAIGGEIFCPKLAALSDDFTPDCIAVAYGTNDWSGQSREVTEENCKAFFSALRANYPQVPIMAITPIWRADWQADKAFGLFPEVGKMIRRVAAAVGGVLVIEGFDLVPHDTAYYADGRLHPNDAGFAKYADRLREQID